MSKNILYIAVFCPMNNSTQYLLNNFYGNNPETDELLAFYKLYLKAGFNVLREVYPEHIFNDYLQKILKTGLELNNEVDNKFNKIISINSEWLRYFVILADVKNFTMAANLLFIRPAALSKAIISIENLMEIKLLERKQNFVCLTPIGNIVLEKSKLIIKSIHSLNTELNLIMDVKPEGVINIAWFRGWGREILAGIIEEYRENFPEVKFNIQQLYLNEIEKAVLNESFDLGLINYLPDNNI